MSSITKVVLRHAGFTYRMADNPAHRATAFRGDELDLSTVHPDDVARGRELGAWGEPMDTDGDGTPDTTAAAAAPFDQGVGVLAEWLKDHPMNGPQTLALAEGDPERARMLIDAEPVATGGKPRKTVLAPLGKLIADAEALATPDDDEQTGEDGPASSDATAGPDDGTAPADGGTAAPGEPDGGTTGEGTVTTTGE